MRDVVFKNNKLDYSWISSYIFVLIVYFASQGLMLVIYGAWWDDMRLWNASVETLEEVGGANSFNNPFIYIIVKSINQINDLVQRNFVFRIIPFICWLVSLTFFFLFLKKLSGNKTYTLYASLLAASCCMNKTVMLICCYHYTISISLFMIGLVFFIYDYYESSFIYKFIVSFLWMFSLLIWRSAVLVIPVALLVSVLSRTELKLTAIDFYYKIVKKLIREYWLIIIGLLVFSVLYKTALAPQGMYASYYSIGLTNLLLSPINTFFCCLSLPFDNGFKRILFG